MSIKPVILKFQYLLIDDQGEEIPLVVSITDIHPGDPGFRGSFNRFSGDLVDPGYPPEPPSLELHIDGVDPHTLSNAQHMAIEDEAWEALRKQRQECNHD